MSYDKYKLATPDTETETEICLICLKEIVPNNSNVVDDLGKAIIVCNFCKNKFDLKDSK